MASEPKEQHCYLVPNFAEFEALARHALHEGEGRKKLLTFKRQLKEVIQFTFKLQATGTTLTCHHLEK